MNYSNEVKVINEFISKSKIDDILINDFNVWPLIRLSVIDKLLINEGVFGVRNHSTLKLSHLLSVIYNSIVSLFSLMMAIRLGRRKFLFVGFSRRTKDGSQAIDKFHDPIINELNSKDCVMIERPFKAKHFSRRATQCPIVNLDFFVYFTEFYSRAFSFFYRLRYKADLSALANKLEPIFSDRSFIIKSTSREIAKFHIQNLFNNYLLKIFQPQKVIVTNRGLHLSLIYCANKAMIETSELQHGITLANDISYTEQNDGLLGVNNFLAFGDYWCQGYKWAGNETQVISFGFKYIEDKRNNLIVKKPAKKQNLKKVLFISQPELYEQINTELDLIAKNNRDCNFVLKLHPQDIQGYRERYSVALSNTNVTVLDNQICDNYSLFYSFDYVFGYNSTMLYEAYYFGCSVFIVNFTNMNLSSVFGDSMECFAELTQPVINFNVKETTSKANDVGKLFFSSSNKNILYEFFKGRKV
ncbi:hypothetical protein CWB77_13670 [Pseudoalteromonas sp. S1610]|nr:hypothetical protein CWB77_13670 [Pseudoalteromonas sp. S1610]